MPRRPGPPRKKQYEIDPESGCWNWLLYCDTRNGRPKMSQGFAHRVYYREHRGEIPPGHDIHHHCGNILCVNPDHLEAVPTREHRIKHRLMFAGRTMDDVFAIREAGRDPSMTVQQIADKFGCDRDIAKKIINGQSFAVETGGGAAYPERYCLLCGVRITGPPRNKKFCCKSHNSRYYSKRARKLKASSV